MKKINVDEIPWIEQRSPKGKYHSFCKNISIALGGIRNVGTSGGGHPFDLQIRLIPPGASVCPFHAHLVQHELFFVASGVGTIRAGDESHAVKPGDTFIHPPAEAHQLTNTGTEDLVVYIIADNPVLDAFRYPDSDKWGIRPAGQDSTYFRTAEADYFDREE